MKIQNPSEGKGMRKAATKSVLAAVLLAFFASAAVPAPATAANNNIGIADYRKILENSYAYGEVLDKLNQEMELAKVNLGKQLMAERSGAVKRQLTLQFEENYTRRRNELVRPLFEDVKRATLAVAREYGLKRVEDVSTGVSGIDITQTVIAKLNSMTQQPIAPSYSVRVPEQAPAQQHRQPAPQYQAQMPQQAAPQYATQAPTQPQYTQAPAQPQNTQATTQQMQQVSPAQQQPQMSRRARRAAAKAAKAQRRAQMLEDRARRAAERKQAETTASVPATAQTDAATAQTQQPATADDAAIAKANSNISELFAELNKPKQEPPALRAPMVTTPVHDTAPAQRSFTVEPEQSADEATAAPEKSSGRQTRLAQGRATRKAAEKREIAETVKPVRPKRALKTADVPAKPEPNSAAEAAGLQRRATRATRNVKAAPAQYRGNSKGNLEVQFGADYDKPDITRMVNLALKNGIKGAYVLETKSQKTGKLFWRARVPAGSKAEARDLCRKLSSIGLSNYITDGK